jgi:hypothetical protein
MIYDKYRGKNTLPQCVKKRYLKASTEEGTQTGEFQEKYLKKTLFK